MLFKKLFKPTKIKSFFILSLFIVLGFLNIFTLQNSITGEVYQNSLFDQYRFQYQHMGDSWYDKTNGYYWFYYLCLQLIFSYATVCIIAFIINRLSGKDEIIQKN